MTTSKPDVQALIEEARTYLVQFGYRNTLIGRLADALEDATALSALSGETETEWGVFLGFRSEPSFVGSEDSALYFMGRPSGSLDKYAVDTDEKQLARRRKAGEWEVVV